MFSTLTVCEWAVFWSRSVLKLLQDGLFKTKDCISSFIRFVSSRTILKKVSSSPYNDSYNGMVFASEGLIIADGSIADCDFNDIVYRI